jgi:heme/copper-type cytochrome/quinol oxidase subunit 3
MSSASEGAPLGVAGPGNYPAPVDRESPESRRTRGSRALTVSSRLLAGASTFFFLSFFFAYFYLRSINVDHMWRPPHVKPEQGLGAAFIVCIILSAALTVVAGQRAKKGSTSWLAPAGGAVALGLAAIVLQCIEYITQPFGPTNGAFASVFVAWTSFYLIAVLATMYWLETQVATEIVERRRQETHHIDPATGYENPDELLPRGLDAAVFYWAYLAGLGVLMYVILYLL